MPVNSVSKISSQLDSRQMGDFVDSTLNQASELRRPFERRWYDNYFFDDGFHFRYLSRSQNRIVDASDRSTIYNPLRAIPKASRQIRGMANLLLSTNPVPVFYPDRVNPFQFPPVEQLNPQTGQLEMVQNPAYEQALKEARDVAKKAGFWLEDEFDAQNITDKLALMVILAAKGGVSFMQVWPDEVEEKIKTQVFDAFDVYLVGTLTELQDSPFLIKTTPRSIAEIKADERFDKEKTEELNSDNRLANSEIKDAYMRARHGGFANLEGAAQVVEKEAFFKEFLNEDNLKRIKKQKNADQILRDREIGDVVLRQAFVEGNIAVLDEYIALKEYPMVDFRFEPGAIYQVPLIERFIPANKSLDLVASRIERWLHTMVTGAWLKRQGEQFSLNNAPGGQIIEYANTPPTQANIAPLPNGVFDFLKYMETLIEEQGVMTTLGNIPPGVRANAAIESLKESEFSNMVIASRRLKTTVKQIAEKFLSIADEYYVSPHPVFTKQGEETFFDVIGSSALEKREALKIPTPAGVIPLKKNFKLDIEIESGMAYTKEAKRQAANELGKMLIELAQLGYVNQETVKVFFKKLLEVYGFGATQEIMEAMEQEGGMDKLGEDNIAQMKVAMAEVMKDLQDQGTLPTSEQRVQEGKVATAETLKDVRDVIGGGGQPKG